MFEILNKEMKEFLRDKTNVFFFILFPGILVFLLGNLLGNLDKAEAAIGDIHVQYVIETSDVQAVSAIEGFAKAMNEDKAITMEKSDDLETAKRAVFEGKMDALVVFEEPLGIEIWEG